MSRHSSAFSIQRRVESKLERRKGKTIGPPIGHKIIAFVDNINVSQVEGKKTISEETLIFQILELSRPLNY